LIPCLIGPDWRVQKDSAGAHGGTSGSGSEGFAEAMPGIIFALATRSSLASSLLLPALGILQIASKFTRVSMEFGKSSSTPPVALTEDEIRPPSHRRRMVLQCHFSNYVEEFLARQQRHLIEEVFYPV